MSDRMGPFSRRLLGIRDGKLRRCWWCADLNYGTDDCHTCAAPAVRPVEVLSEVAHPTRTYLDLLDVADATCRAHDEHEERTA